jgi:hypothetical protein
VSREEPPFHVTEAGSEPSRRSSSRFLVLIELIPAIIKQVDSTGLVLNVPRVEPEYTLDLVVRIEADVLRAQHDVPRHTLGARRRSQRTRVSADQSVSDAC